MFSLSLALCSLLCFSPIQQWNLISTMKLLVLDWELRGGKRASGESDSEGVVSMIPASSGANLSLTRTETIVNCLSCIHLDGPDGWMDVYIPESNRVVVPSGSLYSQRPNTKAEKTRWKNPFFSNVFIDSIMAHYFGSFSGRYIVDCLFVLSSSPAYSLVTIVGSSLVLLPVLFILFLYHYTATATRPFPLQQLSAAPKTLLHLFGG